MTEGDGISFAEFTYPLMQGWDWWHMYSQNGVQMQIGGSDQFGNILTGIDTVKTVRESEEAPHLRKPGGLENDPVGFTVPLLTDSSGAKFGKSAGNAVWLDQFATTAFDLYGYFMRRPDEDVERLLKLFTFLPLPEIRKLMDLHAQDPPRRVAHHALAFEVLSLVHGPEVALRERQQHQMMFSKGVGNPVEMPPWVRPPAEGGDEVSPEAFEAIEGHPTVLNNAPKVEMQLPESLIMGGSIAKILRATGLAASAKEGSRLAAAQGAYVAAAPGPFKRGLNPGSLDWTPVQTWFPGETKNFLIDGRILILRKGKHNVRVVEMVSDEEWKASGKTYLGEPYTGKVRQLMEKVKEAAAAEGRTLTSRELKEKLEELAAEAEEPLTVANNPGIQFPTRSEGRARAMEEKRLARETRGLRNQMRQMEQKDQTKGGGGL